MSRPSEYSERSTAERMASHGDIAQGQCVAWAKRHGYTLKPFGTEHHPGRQRYAPDFNLTRLGLVEVMSTNRSGVLHLKLEKWNGLIQWSRDWTVVLWVYDPGERRGGLLGLDRIHILTLEGRYEAGEFHDEHQTRPWYGFATGDMNIDWEPTDAFIESDYRHGP